MFNDFNPSLLDSAEFKEDSVREVIILPILSRLGYKPSGEDRIVRSKALIHPYIIIGTRKHPVTIIPDYTIFHGDRPVLVLDAKRPAEDILKQAHVQQAYSYAIHPEIRAKHFALCNGRHLAVFDVEASKPILYLSFSEFQTRWSDIEKHLAVKYLLQPELRKFVPDFGFKLLRMGFSSKTELFLPGVRPGLFGRLDETSYTASGNCELGQESHCGSFDFPATLLPAVLAGLPEPLQKLFLNALSRAPFRASADLIIEIDIVARLGVETAGVSETFVPLIIHEVRDSRINLEPIVNEPTDFPPHLFRLRKAFQEFK